MEILNIGKRVRLSFCSPVNSIVWDNMVSLLFLKLFWEGVVAVTVPSHDPATLRGITAHSLAFLRFAWSGAIHIQHRRPSPITSFTYMCAHYTAVCCYNAPINFPFDILRAIYKSCCLSFVPSLMLGNNTPASCLRLTLSHNQVNKHPFLSLLGSP